jgi:hypothetical protein
MACSSARGSDQPKIGKPGEFALKMFLKDNEKHYYNGVALVITKAQVSSKEDQLLLKVEWALEYKGERWPLVILEPSLFRPTAHQTSLEIVAKGKSGKGYACTCSSPESPGAAFFEVSSRKDWFIKVTKEKGKVEGSMEIDISEVRSQLLEEYPDEFDKEFKQDLYLQFYHQPIDRAKHLDLDAWTGEILSPPAKVERLK